MEGDYYQNPLITRYASPQMAAIFGPLHRARIWRELWIALAEAERELGLDVGSDAIAAMRAHVDEIDLARIAEIEAEVRHEVMAHIHQFGEVAPAAKGVIHLGATSAFVMDNADLVQHKEALVLIRHRLLNVIAALKDQAIKAPRSANGRLHALAAGAAHDTGQAHHALDPRPAARSREVRVRDRAPAV